MYFDGQVIEDLRERYFGPSFELKSHDMVRSDREWRLSLFSFQLFLIRMLKFIQNLAAFSIFHRTNV